MRFKLDLPLLALALTFAPSAAAEPTDARDFARERYEQGLELARDGRYEEALREFLLAYDKSPNYAVLYNIGQAYIGLKRPVEALGALERYLKESKGEIPPERLERINKQIAAQRAGASELRILVNVQGATIELDGAPAGTSPLLEPLRIAPGTHLITVRSTDRPPLLRSVTVSPGQSLDLAIELPAGELATKPAPEPAPLARGDVRDRPTPTRAPGPRASAPASRTERVFGYVLGGVGLALGSVALGHYVWNRQRNERWQTENDALRAERVPGDRDARQRANNALSRSIDRAEPVTVAFALSASACLAAGTSLLVLNLGGTAIEPTVATGAGVRFGARGTW